LITQGGVDLSEFKNRIAELDLDVRAVVMREGDGLRLKLFVADALPNTSMRTSIHDYGDVLFIGDRVGGSVLGSWFDTHEGVIAGTRFAVPELQPQVNWTSEEGHGRSGPRELPWPHTRYTLYPPGGNQAVNRYGFVIARDGSPAFPDFERAALFYLYGNVSDRWLNSLPTDLGTIRVADTRAWFRRVHLGLAALTTTIGGHEAVGSRVELSAPPMLMSRSVGKSGQVRLRLPDGIPGQGVLILSRDGECRDFRYVGAGYGVQPEGSGVTVDRGKPEPSEQFTSSLLQGEGPTIEFKERLPHGGKQALSLPLLKTVAAFASASGGVVLFGVGEKGRDKEGEVIGLDDSVGAEEALQNLVRNQIDPGPELEIVKTIVNGKSVIAMFVKADGRVHGVFPDRPQYFIRRGSTTFPARVAEVKDLVRKEVAPPGVSSPFGSRFR
jgi:schlafen family protein